MRKQSTKRAINAIYKFESELDRVNRILASYSLPKELQTPWLTDKTPDYWIGFITGKLTACEEVLHEEKSYYGFAYVDSNNELLKWYGIYEYIQNHPEYRDWRVSFAIR